ncbi:hypothetical protein [Sorangium sp. So ce1389]|uniref:hypothetical protein n=1 Tax=Sorangium sp. So ce1389 TaxID=3133336 RepID=UPI003F5DEB1F
MKIAGLIDGEGRAAEEQQEGAAGRRDLHRLKKAVHHENREIERLGFAVAAEPRKPVAEIGLLMRSAPRDCLYPVRHVDECSNESSLEHPLLRGRNPAGCPLPLSLSLRAVPVRARRAMLP